MKVKPIQPIITQGKRFSFREIFVEPFQKLGFEKSAILISHTFVILGLGYFAGSHK